MKENKNKIMKVSLVLIIFLSMFLMPIKTHALNWWEYYFFYQVAVDEDGDNVYENDILGQAQFRINGVDYYNDMPVILEMGTTYTFTALYNKTYWNLSWIAINGSDKSDFVEYTRNGDTVTFKYLKSPSSPTFTAFLQKKPASQIPGEGGTGGYLCTNYKLYFIDQTGAPVEGVYHRIARTPHINSGNTNYMYYSNNEGYGPNYQFCDNDEITAKIFGLPSGYSVDGGMTKVFRNKGDGSNHVISWTLHNDNLGDTGLFQPLIDFFTNIFHPIFEFLGSFVGNVITGLQDLFIYLFIPDSDDLEDLVWDIKGYMEAKLGFVYTGIQTFISFIDRLKTVTPIGGLWYQNIFGGDLLIDFSRFIESNIGEFILLIIRGNYLIGLSFATYKLFKKVIK